MVLKTEIETGVRGYLCEESRQFEVKMAQDQNDFIDRFQPVWFRDDGCTEGWPEEEEEEEGEQECAEARGENEEKEEGDVEVEDTKEEEVG